MGKKFDVKLSCEVVAEGQYYLNGTRLNFDEKWMICVVNNDSYVPYYRIYIDDGFRGVARYEQQAFDFLLKATSSLVTRL